jgi:hypothetical protein
MTQKKSLRFALALAIGALLVCGSGRAFAQFGSGGSTGLGSGGTTGTGSTFTTDDFFIGVQAVQGVNLSTFDAGRFFDVARCNCATPVTLFISMLATGFAKRSAVIASTGNAGTISVWLGSVCGDPNYQGNPNLCRKIDSEPLLTFLNQGSWSISSDARVLSTYLANAVTTTVDGGTTGGSTGPCTAPTGSFTQTIQVQIDYDGNGTADLTIGYGVIVDLQPPPEPTGITVEGGNQAVIVNWNQVDQSLVTDLIGYQILCSRADQYQVFPETEADGGSAEGTFSSAFESCPANRTGTGVEGEDPTFVCSPLLSAIAKSYRVQILQNGITYAVGVVAIDNSGNASPVTVRYGTPVKTDSFYDVYRDGYAASNNTSTSDPGGASGGFCAVAARRPGRRSAIAIGLFGLGAAGLAWARRRRGRP